MYKCAKTTREETCQSVPPHPEARHTGRFSANKQGSLNSNLTASSDAFSQTLRKREREDKPVKQQREASMEYKTV